MRCPDCNKFVSLDFSDPEVEGELAVDSDGLVTAEVHLTRTCADCCTALKEAQLSMEGYLMGDAARDLEAHLEAHRQHALDSSEPTTTELSVENDGVEPLEASGGRNKKQYFGARVSFTIKCSCNDEFSVAGTMEEKIAASDMDALV